MEPEQETISPHPEMDGWSLASIVGIAAALLMFGGLAAAMYLFAQWALGPAVDETALRQQKLRELVTTQKQQLTNYGWVNKTEGVVHIPIDQAMQRLIDNPPPPRPNRPIAAPPAAAPAADKPKENTPPAASSTPKSGEAPPAKPTDGPAEKPADKGPSEKKPTESKTGATSPSAK